MIIPIHWTERATITNLPELLRNVREQGGSIIEYRRLFSVILFTRSYPVFVWVPPGASRTAAGVRHALFCGLLGWWSFPGLIATPAMVINNLRGGIDLTPILTQPPPIPGSSFPDTVLAELVQARKRQQYVFLAYLLTVLLLVVAFFVIPYLP